MAEDGFENYVIRGGHRQVEGWIDEGALSFLVLLDTYQKRRGIKGAVAEIGVHRGRYFIALSTMRRSSEFGVAIDLLEAQEPEANGSDYDKFRSNLAAFGVVDQQAILTRDSRVVTPDEIVAAAGGQRVRLFSVNSSHIVKHTLNDLRLAAEALTPSGVVILHDWFNPDWADVMGGFFAFMRATRCSLVPFAYGNGQLFLTPRPAYEDYLEGIGQSVSLLAEHHKTVTLCGYRCHHLLLPPVEIAAPLAGASGATVVEVHEPTEALGTGWDEPEIWSRRGRAPRRWGDPEIRGRWTLGSQAEITMMLPECGADRLEFLACIGRSVIRRRAPQIVTVASGGERLAEWPVYRQQSEWEWYRAGITLPAGFSERTIAIQLAFSASQSPKSLGLSEDSRELGIRVNRFVLAWMPAHKADAQAIDA